MIQGPCRLWNVCLFAIIILAVYNIILTLRLTYSGDCIKTVLTLENHETENAGKQLCKPEVQANSESLFSNLNIKLGRWDDRHLYKLFDNVAVGDRYAELSEEYQTCLATQSSINKLESLIEVARHWTGPISVAVFAVGNEEFNVLLLYVAYFRQCFPGIRDRATFHLAFPKGREPSGIDFNLETDLPNNCKAPNDTIAKLIKSLGRPGSWASKLPYPQNHLRNLARKNCQSKFVFLTDVDIVPSKNFAEGLDAFLRSYTCNKLCAYVVPTYELDKRVLFPANKSELVRLASKRLAQPFHHKIFIYNQYATNFTRWQSSIEESAEVHISHPVTNFEFLYEPFYVASDTVPPHDERFVGYGYTRNTQVGKSLDGVRSVHISDTIQILQVYEMFVAGYEFFVLSPIFTCHWGLQLRKSRPSWRERQNSANRKQFDIFKKEVFARYNRDPLNFINKNKA